MTKWKITSTTGNVHIVVIVILPNKLYGVKRYPYELSGDKSYTENIQFTASRIIRMTYDALSYYTESI